MPEELRGYLVGTLVSTLLTFIFVRPAVALANLGNSDEPIGEPSYGKSIGLALFVSVLTSLALMGLGKLLGPAPKTPSLVDHLSALAKMAITGAVVATIVFAVGLQNTTARVILAAFAFVVISTAVLGVAYFVLISLAQP